MRLHEIATCPKYLNSINITCTPDHFDLTKPPPQTKVERKLKKMKDEIRRDETEAHIEIPYHMRNEYFHDTNDSDIDDDTEAQLLDREVRKARLRRKGR